MLIVEPDNLALGPTLRRIARLGFIPRSEREYVRASGRVSPWAMDLRIPLSRSELLRPVAAEMARLLAERGVRQVAGYGYGSFFLISALLSAGELTGGLVRPERKAYGYRKLIEGSLDPARPVWLVDDLLSGGHTAAAAVAALRSEGFNPTGLLVMFRFGWKRMTQARRLRRLNLEALSLGSLYRGPAIQELERVEIGPGEGGIMPGRTGALSDGGSLSLVADELGIGQAVLPVAERE